MVPAGLRLVVGWLPVVAALVAALVTTQVAAYASARRASRIRPTDALRESAGPSRRFSLLRLGVGLAALGGGIATLAVAAHGGGLAESEAPAAGYLTLAAALLGPVLARPFVFCGGWLPAATGSAPALLAWANGRANLRRVASVATPVMVAVSVVGTTYVAKSLLQQETHVQTHRRTSADFVLQASSAEGLPTAVEDAARHISGVTSVTGTVATTAVVAGDGHLVSVPARTVVPGAIGRGLALEVAAGSLEHVRDDGVAVSVRSAHDWGWRLGERVRIRLGDGSAVGVRVVAEYRRPLGFGELVLPRALVAGHVTRPLDDAVYVTAAPAGRRDVEHALRDLRGTYPTLRVLTPDSYVAQIDAAGTKEALEVYVLLALIVLFCALGLVNALTMAVGARSREFATLLLIGATRRQVRSMVRTETLTTLAFGLIVGSLVAFPGLALLEHSLRGSWRPSIPVWTCLGLFASYAVIGMAATVIPLRAALRAATAGAAS